MATVVPFVSLTIGVVGLVNQLATRLEDMKRRFDFCKSMPDNWNSSMKSFQLCKKAVEEIHARFQNDNDVIGEFAINELRPVVDKVKASLENAEGIVNDLLNEFSRRGSSSDRRPKGLKLAVRMDKAKKLLENFDSIWAEARSSTDGIKTTIATIGANEEKRKRDTAAIVSNIEKGNVHIINAIESNREKATDEYEAHFDRPELSKCVVLDFAGDTMEARLKQAVLAKSSTGRVTAAVGYTVHGAVGMGGVGKTVALIELCYDQEVRNRFKDGVLFLSIGQDATKNDVVEGIAYFVQSSGGETCGREIRSISSIRTAAKMAATWFKGRCILFVCDDIWSFDGHQTGYLKSLKLLLSNAPLSAMVISTREECISQLCVKQVKFSPRDVQGEQAQHILLNYSGVDAKSVRSPRTAWIAFRDILDVCAGLPVALGVAGYTLRYLIEENGGDITHSLKEYADELKAGVKSVVEKPVEEYKAFRVVVETSLKHCEKWAQSTEGRRLLGRELNVQEKFEALSVLRKQGRMPRMCLKRLWDTDERASKQLLGKLADLHLVSRHTKVTASGKVDDVAMHDLVLDQAQKLAKETGREVRWHAQLLDGYARKPACNVVESCKYYCRDWWNDKIVSTDGYIEKNLARHLAKSNVYELESLLSDVRWTMRRIDVGGLVGLREDFQELLGCTARTKGADIVLRSMEECWMNMNKSVQCIPFEMFGRLQSHRSHSEFVERFLCSVLKHVPKPHLVPQNEVRWMTDGRQRLRAVFENAVKCLCVSDEQDTIAVTQGCNIDIYDLRAQRITHRLNGHTSAVSSIAMSGDGKRIVSGSDDCTVRVWDAENGHFVVGPLHGHEKKVTCVAMSGDGKRIVSGSDDCTVRVWDADNGHCVVGPLHGHERVVSCVAMSGSGKRIVSGSYDCTVRVWDAENGHCVVGPLHAHERVVRCVAMSGDRKRIVSGSWDKTVRVWDAENGHCVVGPLHGHEDYVECVAMSGNGKRIVSGSYDCTVRVWDAENGHCVVGPLHAHETKVICVAMSDDRKRIVSGSWDKTVRVWDADNGHCVVGPLHGHKKAVICVAMSGDGKRIVSGSDDCTVRVWDAENGHCVVGPLHGHKHVVSCVAMSGDGKRIVSGSCDGTVRVWDAENGHCVVGPLHGHKHVVSCVAISGDGKRIVSGSYNGTVRVWDAENGHCVVGPLHGHGLVVGCVAMSGNGKRIVSGSYDCTVRVWDACTGKMKFTVRPVAEGYARLKFKLGSDICLVFGGAAVFKLDTCTGSMIPCPGRVVESDYGVFVTRNNTDALQIATMPSRIVFLNYNKQLQNVLAVLSDGQIVMSQFIANHQIVPE